MARELLQARFDADTVETVENYADEKEISRSEAMRRLLRTGAETEIENNDDTDEKAVAAYPGTDTSDASGLLNRDSGVINESHLFDLIQVALLIVILAVLVI